MNHNGNGRQKTPASETKTITCPYCSKRRGERGRGKIGKIVIKMSRLHNERETSGRKERTCPVCHSPVRFSYQFTDGRPRVQVLV